MFYFKIWFCGGNYMSWRKCGGNDIDRQLPIKNSFSTALCGEPKQINKQQYY